MEHHSLARDHLVYFFLATDRKKWSNDIVRAHHALTGSRVNRRNSALADALHPAPNFATGGWVWVYNSASTIRTGVNEKPTPRYSRPNSLNWTDLSKILAVGPCSAAEPPMVGRSEATSYVWISLPTCLIRTLVSDRTLQTLGQPPRQRGHAQIPTGGADAVRSQQFFIEVPAVPRHSI